MIETGISRRLAALLVIAFVGACSGDAFDEGPAEAPDGAGGGGGDDDSDDDTVVVGPVEIDVDSRLDVDPDTALADISSADRVTLCGDLLRVFNADVDNARYREVYCTELAWEASSGDVVECNEAFQACLEQVPPAVMSDRVEGTFGCDAGRQNFRTPAGELGFDSACATVGQALACWRAFGVAYERGFLDAVTSAPRSCADAADAAPDLSAEVGFGVPRSCDQLVAAATDCN